MTKYIQVVIYNKTQEQIDRMVKVLNKQGFQLEYYDKLDNTFCVFSKRGE